jgi:hypothetical protein
LRDCEPFRVAARSSLWLAMGLIAVALLTLPGCTPKEHVSPKDTRGGAPAPPPRAEPEPLGINGAVAPRLQWRGCHRSFQCATATVPLDYNQPRAR